MWILTPIAVASLSTSAQVARCCTSSQLSGVNCSALSMLYAGELATSFFVIPVLVVEVERVVVVEAVVGVSDHVSELAEVNFARRLGFRW